MDCRRHALRGAALVALAGTLIAGCSSEAKPKAPPGVSQKTFEQQLAQASNVSARDFPATAGRTLQAIADTVQAGNNVGFATSELVPGKQRLAFGVLDETNRFVYGKTAVYIARSPDAVAHGPYPAPADTLVTKPAFRSQTAASEKDPIASIYAAEVPFRRAGAYAVLVVTKKGARLVGAPARVRVKASSQIPDVGEPPPAIGTDTVASAGGDIKAIDTRVPPARELHEVSLKDVLGRKPTILLFATPQVCQSRVCGPVVDIELQMKNEFGDRLAWIHEEVYRDNQVNKGLRRQLTAFHLQTEPWLFAIDRRGRIAARMEGSFGVNAFRAAVREALGR